MRVKVEACGICHSDAVTKEGIRPGIQYLRVPGHEIAGIAADPVSKRPIRFIRCLTEEGTP